MYKSGKILLTTDTGNTWIDISNKISDTSDFPKMICGAAHFNNNFYAVGSWTSKAAKLYKSKDKGDTWQTYYLDTNQITSAVDIQFTSEDTGFISGAKADVASRNFYASVILKTTDGGKNWATVFSDTTYAGYIWKLQIVTEDYMVGSVESWHNSDSIFMVKSTDKGSTWQLVFVADAKNYQLSGGAMHTQACGFATPAKGWVGGYYKGVFETLDSGKTWNYIKFGYDFNRIFVIDSNHVFAGGNMPYKYSRDTAVGVSSIGNKSNTLHKIHPVVPNPTKGRVRVNIELDSETSISLYIIHIDSKKVYPIDKAYLSKGQYSYTWNSIDAPPGNYIIWLGTNEIPIIQKFVLLK